MEVRAPIKEMIAKQSGFDYSDILDVSYNPPHRIVLRIRDKTGYKTMLLNEETSGRIINNIDLEWPETYEQLIERARR